MTTHDDPLELFELSLLGGAVEHRYRTLRPHADALPWGTLDLSAFSPEEVLEARRGWTDLSLQEYAAAATQGNLLRLLVRARVPLDLSAMLAAFPLDELAHTEICARMAEDVGGATPLLFEPRAVFPPPARDEGSALLQATRAVAWEFCVGETLSLGLLAFHCKHATQPLLRAVWARLARDEVSHARFGWAYMEWACAELSDTERAAVAGDVQRALASAHELEEKVRCLPETAFASIGVFGSAGREAYLRASQTLLEERVVRRLRALGLAPPARVLSSAPTSR